MCAIRDVTNVLIRTNKLSFWGVVLFWFYHGKRIRDGKLVKKRKYKNVTEAVTEE